MALTIIYIDQISEGYIILITGLLIVFSALLTLSLFFKFGMPFLLYVYKIITKRKGKKIKDINVEVIADKQLTGEIAAVISTAVHLYLHNQHDNENAILTIRQARKMYSPWSSKIYGTHNKL